MEEKEVTIGYIMTLKRLMHVSISEAGYYIINFMGSSGLKIEINNGIVIKLDDRNIGLSSIDDLIELRKIIDEFLESKYICIECKFSGMNELHLKHHKQIMGHYENNT